MKAPDVNRLRRWVDELEEDKQWAHHTADLDRGKLRTFPLDRPVTPLSRARRLSRLGHVFDSSIFGGPSYDLTPYHPRNDSPPAALSVHGADTFDVWGGRLLWAPPEHESNGVFRQMHATLSVSPVARCLVSVLLSGKGWPGMAGHLDMFVSNKNISVRIPIEAYISHVVDLTFVPGNEFAGITMVLQPGIQLLNFDRMSVATLPPVAHPDIHAPRSRPRAIGRRVNIA